MNRSVQRAAIMLAFVLAFGPVTTRAQATDAHMLDLPVLVAACERDPGERLSPGGGRFSPEQTMDEFGCDPAEEVSVTVYNREIDFFARCETDDEGLCQVEAPTDPERQLMVAIHMSTVEPGLSPSEQVVPTVHFSEFTGIGIALMQDPDDERDDLPDRRTLAVKVEQDGEPAEVLTQLSEGEISIDEFPWLATNDGGWVSYDLGLFEAETVDLMIDIDGKPTIACSDIDHNTSLETEWIDGREGDFVRITLPETDGDINCDVSLP